MLTLRLAGRRLEGPHKLHRKKRGDPSPDRPHKRVYGPLEKGFQPELNSACIVGGGYLPEVCREETGVIVRELGVVEGVEHLQPELDLRTLPKGREGEDLEDRDVLVVPARAPNDVPSRAAEREIGGGCKCSFIEPLEDGLRPRVGIADEMGVHVAKSRSRNVPGIAGSVGQPGLEGGDAGELPASERLAHNGAGVDPPFQP